VFTGLSAGELKEGAGTETSVRATNFPVMRFYYLPLGERMQALSALIAYISDRNWK
jgi:hypothetical protein